MPIRLGSLGLFFSLVAIALAANQADLENARTTRRGPASVPAIRSKEDVLGPFRSVSSLKHTEKIRGPLSVQIEMLGETPAVGETFVLRGTITSRKNLNNTGYSWSVPQGVEVVSGAVQGELQNVSDDQPAVVELTLKKTSRDNVQVHLMANSSQGEMRFGDSAQFNTDVQSMLGGSKSAVLGKAADASGKRAKASAAGSTLKIFH